MTEFAGITKPVTTMAENQEDVTLSWKQLYIDLDVTDSFPTQKFAEYLKMVLARGSMVTALDFSGIQQLTDDVFIMLKKVTVKTKLRESVRLVNCIGCVQLTDLGLNFLAQAFPALQEVYVAGCHQLTGLTLVYLQRFCAQLITVDMTATSVTWVPALGDNVSLSLTGCPRLPIVSTSAASESATVQQDRYIFHNKLIMMLYTGCDFNVIDFLSQSNARTSNNNKKETKEPKPKRFAYQSGVKLAGIEGHFNVFKCYGNYSLLSLSFTPESIFVIVVDALMDNAQLHIMNRITAIRSSAVYSGVVVLGLHNTETKEEASVQFPALAESIDGYMKQQAAVLESHLQHDAFDSDLARHRDFSTQRRYCRSLRTSQNICQLYFFTLDRDSGHVSLKWPTPNSSVEKPNEDQGDDGELDPVAVARSKWLSDLESVKGRVSRLNKLDLSELRSISEPPTVAQRTMDAMCYFLTNSTEANYRTVSTKYSLLTDILNFNLDSVSDSVISVVDTFIDELLLEESRETINKMPPIFSVIHAWVCAVYGYVTNCLQYERAAMEIKLQEQQRQQEEIERELQSIGPSAILKVFRTILADLYDQKYFNRRVRSNYSNLLRLVEKSLTDLKKQKILSLSDLHEKLASMWAERNEPVLSEPQLATVLHWLNVQGKVLPVRNVPNRPVVFDIPWFVNILAELREEKSSCYQLNGSQYLSLSPQLPLITGKSLASFCETSEPHQFETLMSVLTCRGILVDVPSDTVQKATDPHDAVYFTFLLSAEKPFLRSGLVEGVESFSQFKDKYWPSAGKGSWLESDVKVTYYYNFITGFPVNMVARIIAEWSQLGKMVLIWRSGALVRVGAVEILLRHDVHGTLLSNGLAVEALLTTGWTRDMTDHAVLHEYLSGAISKYLLVIEYIISQYAEVGVTVSMSCQGSCLLRGLPGLIPISELPRQVGFQVKCADCTDEGVNAERCVYYTGRQRFLPFHDWVSGGFSDMNNRISPYAKYYCGDSSSDIDSTLCLFCGCSVKGSLRLWSMESYLHPSFIANSANFVEIKSLTHHQDLFELHGNVLNVYPLSSKSEKRKSPRALLTFSEPIYINGFTQLHVTVLKAGSAQLVFGQDFFSKISPNKLDTSHAFVTYDLQSGEIIPRDVLNKDLPLMPSVKGEPIDVGDKLTVNIIGNKVVTFTDTKVPDLKQSRMVVEFTLKKNGRKFYSGCVRFRSTIGLVVKAPSNDEAMQLVLDAPDHPTVRACNFPLGSSLFYRNSVNSPWSFGYISSTMNGELTVSYPDDSNMVTVKPNSPDIAPVGHYSDGVNVIVIGKDETLSSSQLAQFIRTTKMSPAPIALLRGAQSRLLERYESLGLKVHETKYCSAYNLWPEVVEQAYARFKLTRGKNQKQRAEVPFLLLPANLSLETMLNPVRQIAQDWSKQQLYFICKGFEWNLKNSSQRDSHFLDTKPIDLTTEEINVIFQDALPAVILAYYSMEFRQNILPMHLKTFPAIEESLDTSLLIKPLSDLMLHYRSTLLLMQAMITIRGRTNKKLKTTSNALLLKLLKDSELTNLYTSNVTKDTAADAMSSGVASSLSGLCATHGFVAKKSGISSIISAQSVASLALTAVESYTILRYASCVLHIEIANVQLEAIQFKRLLQSFLFLEGINLTGSDVSSLSGISSCVQLRHLIVHGHQFSDLPPEMSVLVNLETLDITDGPLRSIPDFVCNFRSLRLLSVANTLVSQLPADIGQLSRLKTLNLSRCPMRSLPESVRNLRSLGTSTDVFTFANAFDDNRTPPNHSIFQCNVQPSATIDSQKVILQFNAPQEPLPGTAAAGALCQYSASVKVYLDTLECVDCLAMVPLTALAGTLRLHTNVELLRFAVEPGQFQDAFVTVRNAGLIPFTVSMEIVGNSDLYAITPGQCVIEPGDQSEVQVRFTGASNVTDPSGTYDSVLLMFVEPEGPSFEIPIFSRVISSAILTAPSTVPTLFATRHCLSFGGVDLGKSAELSVTLKSNTHRPLKLLTEIRCPAKSDYQIIDSYVHKELRMNSKELVLNPEQECTLRIRFSPSICSSINGKLRIGVIGTSLNYAIILTGHGGVSQVCITSLPVITGKGSVYCAHLEPSSSNSSMLTTVCTLSNTGCRTAYVCAIPYQDVECNVLLSENITINPVQFCLPPNCSKCPVVAEFVSNCDPPPMTVTGSVVYNEDTVPNPHKPGLWSGEHFPTTLANVTLMLSSADVLRKLFVILFYYGDEISRQKFRRAFHQQSMAAGDISRIETNPLFAAHFMEQFIGEEVTTDEPTDTEIGPDDMKLFFASMSSLTVIVREPVVGSRNGEPVNVSTQPSLINPARAALGDERILNEFNTRSTSPPVKESDGYEVTINSNAHVVQAAETGAQETVRLLNEQLVNDATLPSPVSAVIADGWSILPNHLKLTSCGSASTSEEFKIVNDTDRTLQFTVSCTEDCLSIEPSCGVVLSKSTAAVRITCLWKMCKRQMNIRLSVTCNNRPQELLVELDHQKTAYQTEQGNSTAAAAADCRTCKIDQFQDTVLSQFSERQIMITNKKLTPMKWNVTFSSATYLMKKNSPSPIRVLNTVFSMNAMSGEIKPGCKHMGVAPTANAIGSSCAVVRSSSSSSVDNSDALSVASFDAASPSSGSYQGLIVSPEQIVFPPTSSRRWSVIKLQLKNKDSKPIKVDIGPVAEPFFVAHKSISLTGRRFVKLPVEFRPADPGVYSGVLYLMTSTGSRIAVKLQAEVTREN